MKAQAGEQAQAHRSEHRGDLVAQRFGICLAAGHHDHKVVCVTDEPVDGAASMAVLRAFPFRAECFPLLGEVLVKDGQSDVGQQR